MHWSRRSSGRTRRRSRRSCSSRSPVRPGACLTAPDEYWEAVEEICRRHDILLIADEVMTGFGRTGRRWGHDHFPIRPDIVYGGKGLGGGYVPIGMVAATDDVVAPLRGQRFMYFTFTANDGAVRRRRGRARRARGRAPRRASRRRWATCSARSSPTRSATTPTSSTSAVAACSAASSSRRAAVS